MTKKIASFVGLLAITAVAAYFVYRAAYGVGFGVATQ